MASWLGSSATFCGGTLVSLFAVALGGMLCSPPKVWAQPDGARDLEGVASSTVSKSSSPRSLDREVQGATSGAAVRARTRDFAEAMEGPGPSNEGASSTDEVRTRKREVPDLDGRADPGPDAGEVLLWIPRVLFAPVHLVLEWGIRRPLGLLLTEAEKSNWADILVDFFTFQDRKIGIIPTFFVDFNFRPSVGLYIFWDELFVKPHSIRLGLGYGGDSWYRVSFSDRWALSRDANLAFTMSFLGRPDYIFTGLGSQADPNNRSRYFEEFLDGRATFVYRTWRRSELRVDAGVRQSRFGDGAADDDEVTLTQGVSAGLFDLPTAFEDGYVSVYQRMLARIDSRQSRPANGTGVLVEGYLSHGLDLENPEDRQWLGYGGRLGGFVDLGRYHVLGLIGQLHIVNPVGDRDIPFTELFILSRRPQDLSGFLPGDLIGRSATVLTFEYTYPVWVFIDGALQASVGNAFDQNLRGFDVERLRASLGIGLKATVDQDASFSFLLGMGTSRFDEPFSIESFRLVVGTQTDF